MKNFSIFIYPTSIYKFFNSFHAKISYILANATLYQNGDQGGIRNENSGKKSWITNAGKKGARL